MSPQAPKEVIVVRRGDAVRGHARANPAIATQTLFNNFAAGYLVGGTIAVHPAGEECDLHNHRGAVELFYVLSGRGVITVNGTEYEVVNGDCVVVPVGDRHKLRGLSKGLPFRVFCVFAVAPGHEADPTPWKPTDA